MNIFSRITLKNLMKNRSRTVVTIIGIMLSTALFTAVTTSVSTLHKFLVDYTVYNHGNWHMAAYMVPSSQLNEIKDSEGVDKVNTLQGIGFAKLEHSDNENKPYLYIGGISEGYENMLPVHITSGRMPENTSEILLPRHLKSNGGLDYKIGDVLNLQVGSRVSNGNVLDDRSSYMEGAESIENTTAKTYTVVGFYNRSIRAVEPYEAPGYIALTMEDKSVTDCTYDVFLTVNKDIDIKKYYYKEFGFKWQKSYETAYNDDYIRATVGMSDSYMRIIYGFASVLMVIITFGSISLIYNSFSISVSEQTRQFGILSSIGATKKQIRKSVMTEGTFLAIVGIPLGIIVGLTGIGITFFVLGDKFTGLVDNSGALSISLHPSWISIGIAVLMAYITIMVSAYIPAVRATKKPAIEAIRQSSDIRLKSKEVKVSKLTTKLFGFEGMVAAKNFKRNKRKYRATVMSLFMSVVIFISASSLCEYLRAVIISVDNDPNFDFAISLNKEKAGRWGADYASNSEKILDEMSALGGVTDTSYSIIVNNMIVSFPYSKATQKYIDNEKAQIEYFGEARTIEGMVSENGSLIFVADDTFRELLKDNSLKESDYFGVDKAKAVCVDYYNESNWSKKGNEPMKMSIFKDISNTKLEVYSGIVESGEVRHISFDCDTALKKKPKNMVYYIEYGLNFYFPMSSLEKVFSYEELFGSEADSAAVGKEGSDKAGHMYDVRCMLFLGSRNHNISEKEVTQYIENSGLPSIGVNNIQESREYERNIVTIISVFSYGFIVLISLIAIANVFNTMTTNINLRRRELAMLTSVGMTPAGLRKMMAYECIMYGLKSLIYSIPVSLLATYWIYRISSGTVSGFFIPWYSVAVAVCSVFVVVFTTCIYAVGKLNKVSVVDTLKNENY